MIKSILSQYLLKAILIALIALILYGVFPGTGLAIILAIFVGLRFTSLAAEALRKPVTPEGWDKMIGELAGYYEKLTPEGRAAKAVALRLDPHLSARDLAQAQVNRAINSYTPPRQKRELVAEALGAVAFAILIPLDLALYTRDFFSLRMGHGWAAAGVAALCLGLYFWPHWRLKSPKLSEARIFWWAVPFICALPLFNHAIGTRHPYLNPFDPGHNRLAAERVLSLTNNIVAGRHADWVLRYAHQLDEQGESKQAIHFYREGLRLDAGNRAASARLASLEARSSGRVGANSPEPVVSSPAPYWTADNPVIPSSRRRIDAQLDKVQGCTVVLVRMGEVSDEVLDAVGFAIHQELDLPVCVATDPVPLPPRTRVRGLATGPQWDQASLVQAFTNATKFFPSAPIKFVLITPADIYMDDVNYVFSTTYPWGAIVSLARFRSPQADDDLVRLRTAKQALCALLKSFKVPMSPDRNCVTSYTRNLDEFDAKGNRPNAETLTLFRQAVADMNAEWQNRPAPRAAGRP